MTSALLLLTHAMQLTLHGHERERLRLHEANAINSLHLRENRSLRLEALSLPLAEALRVERSDDLEVQAAAAHDALDALRALHRLQSRQVLVEHVLERRERRLVVIGRPLAAHFARDGVEGDVGRDVYHCACRYSAGKARARCHRTSGTESQAGGSEHQVTEMEGEDEGPPGREDERGPYSYGEKKGG